jgi:hypothetical protein
MDERLVSGYERCSSSLGLFFAKIALSLASGRSPQQNKKRAIWALAERKLLCRLSASGF